MSSVKLRHATLARGGFVSGQQEQEVNKVALTALKYFIALISATIIS